MYDSALTNCFPSHKIYDFPSQSITYEAPVLLIKTVKDQIIRHSSFESKANVLMAIIL